jgi:hypothetical protein
MAIRTGERTFDEAFAEIEAVEAQLAAALEQTQLPAGPDRMAIDRILVEAYRLEIAIRAFRDALVAEFEPYDRREQTLEALRD